MPIIYNVTIEPARKENTFTVTWHDPETGTADYFEQPADITPEESRQLWHMSHHQSTVGEKLFRFLDGDCRLFLRALDQAHKMGVPLQVYLKTCNQTADWPFELLAHNSTFLLTQRLHLVRTVTDWGTDKKNPPKNRPLKLLFMTCSAIDGPPELDYEQEEDTIFQVTEKLAIDMEVEDSGSLAGLRRRLEQEQYDVVHLSGHADIDDKGIPYFIMEDGTGHEHQVYPDELWSDALVENPPRLLFLSGCRTGESPDSPAGKAEVSFCRGLVETYNVPAVLGWGRSVNDDEAIHAEKMLFHELSRGKSILDAVQRTRYELLNGFPDSLEPAWPLLRLFSSGLTLNPIVKKGQQTLPKPSRMKHIFLKNSRVQVLGEGFVGRRRQIQTGLRTLEQDFYKVGILLLGCGGLGKSCLAGKICERFPDHTLIIVQGKLEAVSLQSALTDAFILSRDKKAQQLLSQKIDMNKKLASLCAAAFKEKNYLLLLDDFDQNLEGGEKGFPGPLLPDAAALLKTLLHYLPFGGKMTQAIITCRYDFSLTEQNRDLVEERLEKVWLTSFNELEQRKKARELENISDYPNQTLARQLLVEGYGNPLLLEWLDELTGAMKEEDVPRLLAAVKDKREEFIREHVSRLLLQREGKEFARFLRRFSVYRRPVQEEGAALVAENAAIENWKELLHKGMSLNLIEHEQVHQGFRVTPLLREELFETVEDKNNCHKAAFAYYQKIRECRVAFDPFLAEELVFHALACRETETVSEQGGKLAVHLQARLALREVNRLAVVPLTGKKYAYDGHDTGGDYFLVNVPGTPINIPADFYRAATGGEEKQSEITAVLNNLGEAWRTLGQPGKTIYYWRQALAINRETYGMTHSHAAKSLANLGMVYCQLGQKDTARDYFEKAYKIFNKSYGPGHVYMEAVTRWLEGC